MQTVLEQTLLALAAGLLGAVAVKLRQLTVTPRGASSNRQGARQSVESRLGRVVVGGPDLGQDRVPLRDRNDSATLARAIAPERSAA
jgi:hypothetical protein